MMKIITYYTSMNQRVVFNGLSLLVCTGSLCISVIFYTTEGSDIYAFYYVILHKLRTATTI